MARPKLDITGTAAAAAARGCSRRTIQRERARLREQTGVAVVQSQPVQLTIPEVEAPRLPELPEAPVDPLEVAEDAGWLERATRHRLRQAIDRGDAPAVKLFASALLDVWKIVEKAEPLARTRIYELKDRLQKRLEITRDYKKFLATHGPAYIRAFMPSPSEMRDAATYPAMDEEVGRWMDYTDKIAAGQDPDAEEDPAAVPPVDNRDTGDEANILPDPKATPSNSNP
ncbi:hypothetical protein EBZ80_20650 [bacterium]|nr:hypothetical protein [bacterium]